MSEIKIEVAKEDFEHERVPKKALLDGSYYAAAYSGEHVAGGEFVVGAAFAAWGASPADVLIGLILGNLFAVLSWALICAPVATRARLTLYYYVERLAGKKFLGIFSIVNGLIFAVIAGGMITISASAIRGLTDAPQQVNWYPTSGLFVLCALLVGAVTIFITVRGFEGLTRFAKLCAPWLLTIFCISGIASLPFLMAYGQAEGVAFGDLFHKYIWTGSTPDGSPSFTIWQIAGFAWGLNLPLHLGMGDLSTLRFAKKSSYGYYSAFAAYVGHCMAWVACGVLGATTALMLSTDIDKLDIGGIVVPILGISGTVAVFVSCITTSVPSLYRAGLAFQALLPNWTIGKVTIATGLITTFVACFPLIFLKWLSLMAYFNIAMAPIGAIIFVEHFILPKLGYAPFWREAQANGENKPAWQVWAIGVGVAFICIALNLVHLFLVFIPVWIACAVAYFHLVKSKVAPAHVGQDKEALYHQSYGSDEAGEMEAKALVLFCADYWKNKYFKGIVFSLGGILLVGLSLFFVKDLEVFRIHFQWILFNLSAVYFYCAARWQREFPNDCGCD